MAVSDVFLEKELGLKQLKSYDFLSDITYPRYVWSMYNAATDTLFGVISRGTGLFLTFVYRKKEDEGKGKRYFGEGPEGSEATLSAFVKKHAEETPSS